MLLRPVSWQRTSCFQASALGFECDDMLYESSKVCFGVTSIQMLALRDSPAHLSTGFAHKHPAHFRCASQPKNTLLETVGCVFRYLQLQQLAP